MNNETSVILNYLYDNHWQTARAIVMQPNATTSYKAQELENFVTNQIPRIYSSGLLNDLAFQAINNVRWIRLVVDIEER